MPKIKNQAPAINELLQRGVAEVISRVSLEAKLKNGRPLRVKLGIDPTSPNLHLGRSIPLLKLRQFQQLGHQAIFIIGDATAEIGDASDKDSERPMLSPEQVRQNLKTYIEQAGKIIDIKKATILKNSKWLKNFGLTEIYKLAGASSVNDFLNRENVKKRMQAGKRVSVREMIYPLMQAYDSIQVKADVELGGTDQRFNLLTGRQLQPLYGQAPQDLLLTDLIEGTDGRKMSSSWGNTVDLTDSAQDMFGKIMSLRDELIMTYFIHCTTLPLDEVEQFNKQLKGGANPRDIKLELAKELVSFYHGAKAAGVEEQRFISQFSRHELPAEIPSYKLKKGQRLLEVLAAAKVVTSRSEAHRLLEQGALKIDQKKVSRDCDLRPGQVIQAGKRKFLKLQ